ncbi:hypothetical protein GGP81_003300 [Salinibacter ruber]|nr:hypothetical protein [Salinibacter ruber]
MITRQSIISQMMVGDSWAGIDLQSSDLPSPFALSFLTEGLARHRLETSLICPWLIGRPFLGLPFFNLDVALGHKIGLLR